MDMLKIFWTVLFILGSVLQGVISSSKVCSLHPGFRHYYVTVCPKGCCGTTVYRYCCGESHLGIIIGCTVGGVVLIVVGIVLCCYCGLCKCYSPSKVSSSTISAAVPNYKSMEDLP